MIDAIPSLPPDGRYAPVRLHELARGDIRMCEDCGSLVADLVAHDRHHAILNSHATAIAALEVANVRAAVASTPTTTEDEPRMMKGIWPAPAEGRTVALDDASTPTTTEDP